MFAGGPRGDFGLEVSELLESLSSRLDDGAVEAELGASGAVDPIEPFYERFLELCSPDRRRAHGVYLTPRPLADLVVRLADARLSAALGRPLGLAAGPWSGAPPLEMLDPAVGNGVFLCALFDHCQARMNAHWQARGRDEAERAAAWREHLERDLLPRVHGFEVDAGARLTALLMIERSLRRGGVELSELDAELSITRLDSLSDDPRVRRGYHVVLGNPPWASFGRAAPEPWLAALLADYKRDLDERKLNLDDDYIRFLRVAHQQVNEASQGVIALVTNRSFLEPPTRRGLRGRLLRDFSSVDVLDLGGDRFEHQPGRLDGNLFGIQVGAAVLLLTRHQGEPRAPRLLRLRGSKSEKIQWLTNADTERLRWREMPCAPPLYRFEHGAGSPMIAHEYRGFIGLDELMPHQGSGIKTDRDALVYDRDREALSQRMKLAFTGAYDEAFKARYRLVDSSSYPVEGRLANGHYRAGALRRCLYRPFDERWLYYQPGFTSRPARSVMRHMEGENLALIVKRQANDRAYSWFFCADGLVADGVFAIDNRGRERVAPLFLDNAAGERRANLAEGPRARFCRAHPEATPRDVLYCLYAIAHAPAYRRRYHAELRAGPPRFPPPRDQALFVDLAALGRDLVTLHLNPFDAAPLRPGDAALRATSRPSSQRRARLRGERLEVAASRIWLGPRSEDLWRFEIGGQAVLKRWLKDHLEAARQPNAEALEQLDRLLGAVARSLDLSERVAARIAEAGGWPAAFA